jgi:thiamine kinase-like enzyme
MPQVLPPLSFWPELGLVLQPEVSGRAELNDLAFSQEVGRETRERWLRDAGARLAGLHAADLAAPARSLQDDLEELREYVAPMTAAAPALAGSYAAALARVAELARGRDEPALVPSHGAFRTDQFMIQGERLVLIDLDGFCRANAARDIGNFLAYLSWKSIRQPERAALIDQAAQLFLEGYRAAWPGADLSWLAVYQAASMLKIAGRRYRSLTIKEWPLTPALVDGAMELIG